MDLEKRVEEYIEKYHLLKDEDTVIVGVSGGVDSIALLHVLLHIGRYSVIAVHVNHHIRGEEADRDQAFVEEMFKQLGEKYGLEYAVFHGDIPTMAKERNISEEEMGRIFRYQCFAKIAKEHPGSSIAVAHHMEDQAETMLFRMSRGTGLDGLNGMQPKMHLSFGDVIRPFLGVHRMDLEKYLKKNKIAHIEDSTNLDTKYSRNYVRHEIMPRMINVNLKAVEHLCQLSQQASLQNEYISSQIGELYEQYVVDERDGLNRMTGYKKVSLDWIRSQHLVIQTGILRRMLGEWNLKDVGSRHLDLIIEMIATGSHGEKVQLPNQMDAFLCYNDLLVGSMLETYVPMEKTLKNVTFREHSVKDVRNEDEKTYTKSIDYAKIMGTLTVRYRHAKDKIGVDSLGHEKSFKKFLIDEKIPQHMRDRIPLVCDGDTVVWAIGYRLNPAYYVDDNTSEVMTMTYLVKEREEENVTDGKH